MKKLLRSLLFSGLGLVALTLVVFVGMKVAAKKQTAEMDAIASEFLQQYPTVEQNASAKTLDNLSATLGLKSPSVEAIQDFPEPAESANFQNVEDIVRDYFDAQKNKEQGPLDPIPAPVQTYLTDNQEVLSQIQTHLNSKAAPVWRFDAALYTDFESELPSYLGLIQLHKILLLKAVNHAQQNQQAQMVSALEASHRLSVVTTQRLDLMSYLVTLIAVDDTVILMRHLDGIPPSLSEQLLTTDLQQLGVDGLRFENWTFYQAMNHAMNGSAQARSLFDPADSGLAVLPSIILGKPYLTLSSVNTARIREKSHDQMEGENICSLDVEALDEATIEEIPWWNMVGQIAIPAFSVQWRKGGDRMLTAELTHLIVQAKALAAEQGNWPETLPDLSSQTCPDEHWVYEVSPEGEMSLSFSREFYWRANDDNVPSRHLPLTYRADLSYR